MAASPNLVKTLRGRRLGRHPQLNDPVPREYRGVPTEVDGVVLVALKPDEMAVLREYWAQQDFKEGWRRLG